MYVIYEDKKSIFDHIKLHKLRQYDIKFEEKKKELLDNIPQILTTFTENDELSRNFIKTHLGFDDKLIDELKTNLNFIRDYMREKYPQHFVNFFYSFLLILFFLGNFQ
jgi:hypothetical protein